MKMLMTVMTLAIGLAAGAAVAEEAPPPKTLSECVAIAIEHHPSLKAAAASVQAGHARVWEAAAPYLPQITASYAVSRRQISPAAFGSSAPTSRSYFYNTGASLTQTLFDFGQTLEAIRSAQASEQSLQADLSTQLATVVLNLRQSYFTLLANRRLLGVADETVHQNQKHLEQAEGRFKVGLAAKIDVTTAQVQLATAELNQVTARNNVAVARETLRNALGLTGPLDFDIVDNLDVHQITISEDDALAAAYDLRPELRSIQAQERATAQQIASLQRSYLPTLQAQGNYNWQGEDYPLSDVWTVTGNVTLPIMSGGLTTAQIAEQKANLANLRFNEEVERQNIALEVRQAVLNLAQAAESIRVSDEGLREAHENLDLAEGRYKTGVGNIIELTDAQASLTTAEASDVQALYTYKTTVAALEKATAKQLESD
ncbi:MAG TPA: TolC family protein [Candidatus Acidoferrales bacterium]|nr:TolC family protein [Candidatus Acidoferrales bacterium]